VREVREYRAHVDQAMGKLLGEDPDPTRDGGLRQIVQIGLNHEQQHQELILTDLKHVFSVNPLRPVYRRTEAGPLLQAEPLRWIPLPGGLHEVGHSGPGFHFDNEGPRHTRFLEPYRLASRPSTNGEFLAFMEDGGYETAELWMSEGWSRKETEGWTEPFYWELRDGDWWTFTLHGMRRVDPAEPVCHLTWFEADAFARWSGARLPREDEWEVASNDLAVVGNLADRGRFHPMPAAAASSPGEGADVPAQMFGDVWEWTSSAYSPYPGYRPPAGAIGEYNGKFMCAQFVLKGGSCATPSSHVRSTYRNFFHPDSAWQFSGVRLAREAT
jgi:ergothioneine biosynthesis protein EgtB